MKHYLQRAKLITFLLVVPFLHFAQIYPLIHFHHTHSEDAFEIVVSIHPVDQPTDNHADHEAGEHGHQGANHVTGDWDYTKISLRQALIQPLSFYPSIAGVTSDESITPILVQSIDHSPAPHTILFSPIFPRGLPTPS